MSNIYIQEPPTSGKVLLKTTVGDIDLELWSKEAPKASRNFVQLCLEGYYDGTVFHRVVKGFIVQGGDPTGTGTGGESVYGHPFKDEFHSRLRFNRRGLLAMANAGKNDNGSQFFFTLAATPELQNKHTIFGKVTGETLFNMLKLEDALVDRDDRPVYPQKVIKTEVLLNPFPDIVPRCVPKDEEVKEEKKKKKDKSSGVKNFKLLSFGEEAEEDEEETIEANKKYSGRSKSTHDLLDDPSLSAVAAVGGPEGGEDGRDSDLSGDEDSRAAQGKDDEEMKRIMTKLKRKLEEQPPETSRGKDVKDSARDDEEEEEYDFGKERRDQKSREAENIRKEIRDLKRGMQNAKKRKEVEEEENERNVKVKEENEDVVKEYKEEKEKYKEKKSQIPKKGVSRESLTLAMLAKFQKKLATAKEQVQENSDDEEKNPEHPVAEVDDDDDDNSESWLTHKLRFEEKVPVLAKDASTKNDDWFEIFDPRNPINKRRREASKQAMKSKERK
ncbi:spliceosome-associated protein CWC27 homolog [Bacillus rossius redtenbacheri]|uniref:spliceosome-associated protein CWC27 homolog n=1 Tax=Bacillus rossius redtenbacheri TaxID=93214 RepID=UPI002FDE983B